MFSAIARTAASAASASTGAVRGLSTTSAAAGRKFFVGGNWKCNGTASEVKVC